MKLENIRTLNDALDFMIENDVCTKDGELSVRNGGPLTTSVRIVSDIGQEVVDDYIARFNEDRDKYNFYGYCSSSGEKTTLMSIIIDDAEVSHRILGVDGDVFDIEFMPTPQGRKLRYANRDGATIVLHPIYFAKPDSGYIMPATEAIIEDHDGQSTDKIFDVDDKEH